MDRIKEVIKAFVSGVCGFIVISSIILASLWLREKVMPRQTLAIELSPDDVLEQLAQSDNFIIKCEEDGGRIALRR